MYIDLAIPGGGFGAVIVVLVLFFVLLRFIPGE